MSGRPFTGHAAGLSAFADSVTWREAWVLGRLGGRDPVVERVVAHFLRGRDVWGCAAEDVAKAIARALVGAEVTVGVLSTRLRVCPRDEQARLARSTTLGCSWILGPGLQRVIREVCIRASREQLDCWADQGWLERIGHGWACTPRLRGIVALVSPLGFDPEIGIESDPSPSEEGWILGDALRGGLGLSSRLASSREGETNIRSEP